VVLLVWLEQTTAFKNVTSAQERSYENPLVLSVQESEKFEDKMHKMAKANLGSKRQEETPYTLH
jgi:hypothetical protein